MRPYDKRYIIPRSFLIIILSISCNYSRDAKLSSDQVFAVVGHHSGALFLTSSFLSFFYIYFTSDFQKKPIWKAVKFAVGAVYENPLPGGGEG